LFGHSEFRCETNANGNAKADGNSSTHRNSDPSAYGDRHSNRYTETYRHSDRHACSDRHAESVTILPSASQLRSDLHFQHRHFLLNQFTGKTGTVEGGLPSPNTG
jgi:hypothetical protein